MTHAYAHAHFSNKRVIRELRSVVPRGRGLGSRHTWFERDNCEILQSDWTIPNRAGVPRKSTKVPRPSFVRESREGLGPRLIDCPDIRQITHLGPTDDVEGYLQATGRAGRDGKPCTAILLQKKPSHRVDRAMLDYLHNATECRRKILFKYFELFTPPSYMSLCVCCDICAKNCNCAKCKK